MLRRAFSPLFLCLGLSSISSCSDDAADPALSTGGTPPVPSGGSGGSAARGGAATTGGTVAAPGTGGNQPGRGGSSPTGGGSTTTGGVAGGPTTGGVAPTAGMAPTGGAAPIGGSASAGINGNGGSGGTTGGTSTAGSSGAPVSELRWVGTWASGQQLTETENNPPSPGLNGNSLRQFIRTSIAGTQVRVKLSNAFGTSDAVLDDVHVAMKSGPGAIDTATDKALTFSGMPSVTIAPGKEVHSDTFEYPLKALSDLAITIHFKSQSGGVTGHPGSRTTSYIQTGNTVTAPSMEAGGAKTEHWYFIAGVDVMAPADAAAVVVFGDSISDGRGSTTDANNRWPDALARRLQNDPARSKIAVLNQGVGGNCMLSVCKGPSGVTRFDSDVLGQTGVKWLIILHGVNDIGSSGDAAVATKLIDAYKTFAMKARAQGIKVYASPILPFGKSSFAAGESARKTVNDWIRMPGNVDAVIDLEAAVRDETNPLNLAAAYDSGDGLHLNAAGYQKMGDSVDLSLFE